MKNKLVEIAPYIDSTFSPVEVLSLLPFITYLKKISLKAGSHRKKYLLSVIRIIESKVGASGIVNPARITELESVWQLIYATITPIIEEEKGRFWALSMPVCPNIFYGTDDFYNTIIDESSGLKKKNLAEMQLLDMQKSQLESRYSMILSRCYNIHSLLRQELIYPFEGEGTGLTRYFRIHLDDRFIEISPTGELPVFSLDLNQHNKEDLLTLLMEQLPLNLFKYEGICAITITEATAYFALEKIKKNLLTRNSNQRGEYYPELIKSLQSLAFSKDIEFGLFPLLKVNNKHIFNRQMGVNSKLITMFEQQGMEKESYDFFGKNYLQDPHVIFMRELPETDEENQLCVGVLRDEGIKSFVLVPISFGNKLCGVLEIYSRVQGLLKEDILARLEPALPFIAQIYQRNIDDFESEIEELVKMNFTSVQPAVQWKFNEASWHYIRDKNIIDNKSLEIENIAFEEVYPLYGAIDLRNSTIERNDAMRKDLNIGLGVLIAVLEELRSATGFALIDEKIFQCKKWLERIELPDGIDLESRIKDYLENEIAIFLTNFKDSNPVFASVIDRYFKAVDQVVGTATENQRQLEQSMSLVISTTNNYIELMQVEMQKAYPCYFEKFRTDGVEYDVYIGQSMSPDKPFSEIYLGNLRLIQLSAMADIAKHTFALQSSLKKPIETTQLIFIHSRPIDILFRKDEKRFDVEGAYNIRYHIVKKRIDKVRIKGTGERLTLPNKIALVYFNQKEADGYTSYIRYLQEKGILGMDIEYLELEQLQGISGLRAMRVTVIVE